MWREYSAIEPFGPLEEAARTARLGAFLGNLLQGLVGVKSPTRFEVADLMPVDVESSSGSGQSRGAVSGRVASSVRGGAHDREAWGSFFGGLGADLRTAAASKRAASAARAR